MADIRFFYDSDGSNVVRLSSGRGECVVSIGVSSDSDMGGGVFEIYTSSDESMDKKALVQNSSINNSDDGFMVYGANSEYLELVVRDTVTTPSIYVDVTGDFNSI